MYKPSIVIMHKTGTGGERAYNMQVLFTVSGAASAMGLTHLTQCTRAGDGLTMII